MRSGQPVFEECLYLRTAAGDILPVGVRAAPLINGRGELIGGVQTFRDVTAVLQHRFILDSVADGVFTVDHQFRLTSFNRALERMTGYAASEVLGRPCREIFTTELCGTDNCPMVKAIASGISPTVHNLNYQQPRRTDHPGQPDHHRAHR